MSSKQKPLTKAELILRVRALELDNQRLTNLLNLTPQMPYTDDDLGEQTFQISQEWARRGLAAQKAVNKIMSQINPGIRKSGANDMKEGDIIIDAFSGFIGKAGEFTQDGDVTITSFDGKKTRTVKWNNCSLFSGLACGHVVTEGKIVGAQG